MCDYARRTIGIDTLNADGGGDGDGGGWTGRGEVVAVVDSGLDSTHPDFAGRVRSTARGVAGGTDEDLVGHGTHVAGIAVGDGAASGGKVRGMAPGAELVAIGITDEAGRLQLPPDLGDLLAQAADQGANIINLSWTRALASAYDQGSRAVDAFVRDHPDVLVVVAAGNEGRLAGNGYPGIRSMGTPATAKNVLTVGACASARPDIADTWGAYRPDLFATEPTRAERVAGDPSFVAPISSRGPTDFESVKPDLVAPGTAILAPRAHRAPARRYWREWPEYGGRYALMHGTSMATPVVSGAAAVAQHVLRQDFGRLSAAALKAVLVAATQPLPWHRPESDERIFGFPDFDQGFGRLDLTLVLPGAHAPEGRRLWIDDIANGDPAALESRPPVGADRKAVRRYRFTLGDTEPHPLRVVLSWTDYNELAVQNCLALELRGPDGLRVRGNARHLWKREDESYVDPKALAAQIDRRNNVQAVGLDDAVPGTYTLTIFATNTLFPPQGYGLCVCGWLADTPAAQ